MNIKDLEGLVNGLKQADRVGNRPYKVYTALLTQSGTDAPVATVLENTLGATLIYSYNSTGAYTITASNACFTSNKTLVIPEGWVLSDIAVNPYFAWRYYLLSTSQINISSTGEGGSASNDVLGNTVSQVLSYIEIRVYP